MRTLLILTLLACGMSCMSPQKAYENGNYKKALALSKKKLKSGKNISENKRIAIKSSHELAKATLARYEDLQYSDDVDDWIKVNKKYFSVLQDIGQVNRLLDGEVSDSYDRLCTAKKDIDYKIVDHFYTIGNTLLIEAKMDDLKLSARDAHAMYKKCEKHGGENEFYDLDEKVNESEELGIEYFTYDGECPQTSFWFRHAKDNENVDCHISTSHGAVSFTESRSSNTKRYSKQVETGRKMVKDTSGLVTYEPIYEDVHGEVETTEVVVCASVYTYRYVERLTHNCSRSSMSYHTDVTDSYEEVKLSGDSRAIPGGFSSSTGPPLFFQSNLKDDLLDKAISKF